MKAVLTRVSSASVVIDGKINGSIRRGFLILLGIGPEDTKRDATKLAEKLLSLRVFTDEAGKMNLGLEAVDGQVLVVSQFTLYGSVRKGRRPSFTHLKPDSESFQIVTPPPAGSLEEFCAAAGELAKKQDFFIDPSSEGIDMIFFSCLPWLDLTALTNERNAGTDDAIPRIAWGKYVEENGRLMLGLSIEVNHRFIDGLHIGLFARELEKLIAEL